MSNAGALSSRFYREPSMGDFLSRVGAMLASNRRLQAALVVSALVHVFLLSIHFGFPARDTSPAINRSLEVVLVNARHARAPDQADLLAQANLDGGGTTEQDARPTTPVPPQDARRDGDALIDAVSAPPEPRPLQQEVLTRPAVADKPAPKVAPERTAPPAPPADTAPPTPSGLDLMNSIAAIARMEAQIDRSLNEYAKRPRKQFIGARTHEYRFAQYVEDWRRKIERVGTLNYPEAARGRMYGSLLLSVVIRADGSIDKVEVQRSSGLATLDEAAVRIVELAAPFAPFPPDVRVDTDMIEITRTWTFTNANQLSTR